MWSAIVVAASTLACSSTAATTTDAGGGSDTSTSSGDYYGPYCNGPKDTCQKCLADACPNRCADCKADPACVSAWAEYNKCFATLPPPASCTRNDQCPVVCLSTNKCSGSDDSPCLPFLKKNDIAAGQYNCLVNSIVPCSGTDECLHVKPL